MKMRIEVSILANLTFTSKRNFLFHPLQLVIYNNFKHEESTLLIYNSDHHLPRVKILNRNSQLMPSGDQTKLQRCRKRTGKSRKCSKTLRGSPVKNRMLEKTSFFVKYSLIDSYLKIYDCML